jgi:putative transposase
MQRAVWYYKTCKDDKEVISKLHHYAELYPTRGFDEYYGMIRNEGLIWNRKRVLRIYRSLKLSLRRKRKRRLPARIKQPLQQQFQPDTSYSIDFMSDALMSGRRLRVLNIMDDCTRESLAAYADYSIPAEKVITILKDIIRERSKPEQVRVDNGPEFISNVFKEWCSINCIEVKYIQPGRPMQNGYIERLNRTYREDILDAYQFDTLEEVRILSDEWQHRYNHLHPHKSLKKKSPDAFRRNLIINKRLNEQ